ncbi:hypothetical protein CRI77_21130 [Mycolicibacterium duvalii]|uniref:Uncharacterized protein n=1 Tax=Mycolicibacterium duvalii TaxID=39688 RepID=A0A7I7JYX4_9MYCO|nr:hypothetical protein [Mycolicibacterium duvalii]MCV7370300.1 hypothetical protein [Mycolicibacterium duvalii]PEG37271.1 hypothetical protein CRI77_21130 [Mycolicibacterium duvalii]BBX16524.1 hypothetical protein MDUV_13840 [Mycolicibacterium duvalii]
METNGYARSSHAGTDFAALIAQTGGVWQQWGWEVLERDGFNKPNRFGYGPDGYTLQIQAPRASASAFADRVVALLSRRPPQRHRTQARHDRAGRGTATVKDRAAEAREQKKPQT